VAVFYKEAARPKLVATFSSQPHQLSSIL